MASLSSILQHVSCKFPKGFSISPSSFRTREKSSSSLAENVRFQDRSGILGELRNLLPLCRLRFTSPLHLLLASVTWPEELIDLELITAPPHAENPMPWDIYQVVSNARECCCQWRRGLTSISLLTEEIISGVEQDMTC